MAKKHRVSYAFTNHATYANLAKKDEYTVYFVYDTIIDSDGNEVPSEYGTIYKGETRVGSARTTDIVFSQDVELHFPTYATDDDSLLYTIKAGTSLEDYVKDAIALTKEWDEVLRERIENVSESDIPAKIASAVDPNIKDEYWNGENLATTSYVESNYVSNDKLGKIQELANILDDQTIDQLIKAAEGISAVLSDYYTKDEADALIAGVNQVLTFDVSTNFPTVGDEKVLYVDDSENIMYRWALIEEGSTDRDYVEITGGDSGSTATVESKIYFKGNKTTATIAKNVAYGVQFIFSSAYTYLKYDKRTNTFKKIEQQTGNSGAAKYYLDGTLIGSGNVSQSKYDDTDESKNTYNTFTIPAARFTGNTHELRIVCTDINGNTAENTITISVVSVSIVSSYTSVPTSLLETISIPVTVSSSNEIKIHYNVDNEGDVLYTTLPGSAAAYTVVNIPNTTIDGVVRTHGYHNIKVWATTHISETDTTISTEVLSYNIIWYDVNNETPIISTTIKETANSEGNYDITQYEYVTLDYQIYPKGTVYLIVADADNNESIVNTLDVTTSVKTWSYTFDNDGTYYMYVKVKSGETEIVSTKYCVIVAKSEYAMDPTPDAVLFFTAKNRSNDENPETRQIWKSEEGDCQAVFEGFNWNDTAGWHKEDDSDTCSLRVGGGARVRIPFYPFAKDYRENGQTIEFEYKTSALSNSQTTVISCFSEDDKSGIIIKATEAEFYSMDFQGDSAITVPFKENEKIRISFVITPYAQDDKGRGVNDPGAKINLYDPQSNQNSTHNTIEEGYWRFVKIYINGVLSSLSLYSNGFMQTTPSYITIGSDEATVDVYSIRAYNKVLYSKAVVDNYIADTQDATEKLKLFKRNNILTEDGTDVDYTALMKQVPCLFVTCESTASESDFKNDEHILPRYKGEKRGYTVVFNADNLTDDAKQYYDYCTSFIAYNAQMTVQGTSSQYYPRKNWKLTFKPNKKYVEDWEAQIQTTKPTYLYLDDINATLGQKDNYAKEYVLKDYDKLNPGTAYSSVEKISSQGAKKFCLKADFAESSGTHNTGMARYVDYILKTLGGKYLTPPQYAQYLAAGGGVKGMYKVDTRTTVDGYPIAMFWRPTSEDDYSFYGKFNFNIDKGAENTFGFVDLDELTNSNTGKVFNQFNEDWYDAAPIAQRFEYESPIECYEFLNNSDDISKFKNVTDSMFTDIDVTEKKPSWLNAFEVRHPDSDLQNEDYVNGKDPLHWRKFCKWMTSTDRSGYHDPETRLLPVPHAWEGSSESLQKSKSDAVIYYAYIGNLETFLADDSIDKEKIYILYPEDTTDPQYEHVMQWSNSSWVDLDKYTDAQTSSVATAYYIADTTDPNYGKVYKYNNIVTKENTAGWNIASDISSYALDAPVKYENTTYQYDTAEYRLAKFTNELSNHMNINMTAAYYVLTEFFAMADQRAKNMMFASWGYEPGASKIKEANAFADEEKAAEAGYKPVYEYGEFTDTVASLVNPMSNVVLGAATTNVCINEIYANSNVYKDASTKYEKFVELYNPTDSDVNLEGWILKKGDSLANVENDKSLTFTSAAVVPARGYFVVEMIKNSSIDNVMSSGISANSGFALRLYDNAGALIDQVDNGAVDASGVSQTYVNFTFETTGNESYCRTSDGADTWAATSAVTYGTANIITDGTVDEGDPSTKLYSYQAYETGVQGFSGICWNTDKTSFYAVGDRGKIYSLGLDGTTTLVFDNSEKQFVDTTDFEAITITTDGTIYVSTEDTDQIVKISSDFTSAEIVATINDIRTVTNQGFEGLSYYKDDIFFVGNQSDPVNVFQYSLSTGIVADSSFDPTTIDGMSKSITEIADLYYDSNDDRLWILDSKKATLAKVQINGTVDALYSIPLKTGNTNENPEAVLIDSTNNFAWIGCDNEAAKYLYKVSLTNEYFGDKTIVINELDPENKRWELYNCTDNDINLKGYSITKDGAEATRFTFGDVIINAKGFLVLEQDATGINGPTFGLSPTKGFYYRLFNADGNLINEAKTNDDGSAFDIPDGMTYGAITDGADEFVLFRNYGTIGSTNAEGIVHKGIYINEVDSTGNDIGKRFEIYNANDIEYDLTGHTFIKDDKSWAVVATAIGEGLGLPAAKVSPKGYLVVQCNNTSSSKATELSPAADDTKWPNFGISSSKGYVLAIKDAEGSYIDKVKNLAKDPNFIAIGETQTWGRAIDGGEHDYRAFDVPTLGAANAEGTLYVPTVVRNGLLINEVSPNKDQIELYNSTDAAIALDGYIVSKDGDALSEWVIPANITIAAHGYYVITGKQYDSAKGPKFGLSGTDGFLITIATSDGVIVDAIDNRKTSSAFTTISGDYSYGRKTDGATEWVIFSKDSIGETNTNGTEYVPVEVDPGTQITDHIVINEICGDTKMIELYNPTSTAITLGGSYGLFKEDVDPYAATDWYAFPEGAEIPAKGYFNVKADKKEGNPGFGISLKPGKSFYLRLLKYDSTPDTTTKETLLNSTTIIDEIDNLTNPVNAADGSNMTYGRVHDGTSNWTLFEAPGTISSTVGALTDTNLSNKNGTPHSEEVTPDAAYRRVLYWVPTECEYIYYPLFYDNDTILSLDNEGHIKFEPNVESTDTVGTGYAFNGTESVLWLNFKDAFASKIADVYSEMRTTALTEANCLRYFTTEHSDRWAEALYNVDAQFKYVDPETKGYIDYQYTDPSTGVLGANRRDSTYLYEAQGSREEHRKWWINNRFAYMDSRYNVGDYFNNRVTLRLYTPRDYDKSVLPNAAFDLIPYSDMYLRIRFGTTDTVVRAEKNKKYTVAPTSNTSFNDTETIIYGPSSILSFGDMANKYARTAQFDNATKATEIKFGAASPYYNKNLTEFSLGANNTVLKTIDVRGCTLLEKITSLNAITSLETFRATDTAMSTVDFSTKGARLTTIEYPSTLTQIKLINMPYITNTGITIPNYSNISQLWIESCPNMNTWNEFVTISEASNSRLTSVRLTDINWTINTGIVFNYWKKLLTMKGINDSGYINLDIPYLTGTVTIGENVTVSTGYKENVEKIFKNAGCDLTINTLTTSVVRGITIVGEESIATDEEYTYKITYNPDDYIEDDQRGVTWNIPEAFTVVEETSEYVTIKYVGSTSGTEQYILSATSKYNTDLTAFINILPIATLSAITLTDNNGNVLTAESTLTIDEDSSITIHIGFIPAKTKDTEVTFTFVGGDSAFKVNDNGELYQYDSTTQQLVLNTKSVTADVKASFRVNSKTVTGVRSVAPNVIVKNVIARVLTLQDSRGNKLPGSATITYTNAFSNEVVTETIFTSTGEFILPANTKYGTEELTFTNIKPTVASTKNYNNVGTFKFNKVEAEYLTEDVNETITFYEPVEYTLNIWHDNNYINDASLNVYSFQNEREYGLVTAPYNNSISSTVTSVGINYCQTKIKLLANTTHDITISEVTSSGAEMLSGKIYENLSTTITTGTTNETIDIYLNKDYLGDIDSYRATKLHMTVKTGANNKSIRLYVKVTDTITIDWGDNLTTVIDGTASSTTDTEDHSFNKELVITHAYANPSTEYDIWVHENTSAIKWFHVSKTTHTSMLPCFYNGTDVTTIPTKWSNNLGGLVAYQSIGAATFEKPLSFKVSNSSDKDYILLGAIGYLYDKVTDMTSADELFMNTKLEQLPASTIFKNNKEISSFNRTFKNCNITSIPNAFFMYNTKAVSFEETFSGCSNLVTIHSSEDSDFIYLAGGLEIQSLYRMFYNCSKLTDNVPSLWKTFYGCSKARGSYSYEGCKQTGNYATIPADWGGKGETYYESNPRILDYITFTGGEGYFEFADIIPSNNTRYELEMSKTTAWWYEGMPIFGGGYSTDLNEPDANLVYAIDFMEGGDPQGNRTGGAFGGLRTRIGSTQNSNFLATTLSPDDTTEYPSSYGVSGIFPNVTKGSHRLTIDICKTYSGVVQSIDHNDASLSSPITYIQGWTNDTSYGYNLPLRLFGSYDSYHNVPGDDTTVRNPETGYNPESWTDDTYHIPVMSGRNFSQEIFHELKIYAPSADIEGGIGSKYNTQELVHDIVPAYGMIDGELVPFMYDTITKKSYPYSPQHGDNGILTEYDRVTTNKKYITFYVKKSE
jgi:hypothetical protein